MEQATQQRTTKPLNITLRKANALQQSILDLIRSINFETQVTINEFESPETKISEATTKLAASLTAVDNLYAALYSIRLIVGNANSDQIDGLLTRIAHIEKSIQTNNTIVSSTVRTDLNVIAGKLEKIKTTENTSPYGRTSEVITGVFTAEVINQFKAVVRTLKKEKQKLQDKVLELNISTTIELPSDVVATLEDADLL